MLDIIHHFVEVLDKYFGNVCELDLIYNFHKAYFIMDELIISGYLHETNKKQALKTIQHFDSLCEDAPGDDKIKEI